MCMLYCDYVRILYCDYAVRNIAITQYVILWLCALYNIVMICVYNIAIMCAFHIAITQYVILRVCALYNIVMMCVIWRASGGNSRKSS